ncbi:MAG: DUF1254 domain-containing protein [bacterium]|nr:DUF1254 domain-containing protein [bacterium]
MRRALPWILAALVGAAVVHTLTIRLLPWAIMRYTMRIMAHAGGPNHAVHPPRVDATARAVVRPSPDLLYSACTFDVSGGPVHVTAEVPRDTYWSISMFAADTDNFFVLSDRQANGDRVDVVVAAPGAAVTLPPGAVRVDVPTTRGVILERTLVIDEARLPELDAVRRRFTCAPLA